MNRSGIALVLVMVVLAALLLLGVPFLASQSASLSGSRQLAQRTQAALSRDAAEGQGIAVAIAIAGTDLSRSASATRVAGNRFLVRANAMPGTPRAATHGSTANAVVEDESGKLDAATLGEEGWGRLLAAVGITDWQGVPQWRWFDEAEGASRFAAGTLARDGAGYEIYGEWTRNGTRGQLARTLAQAGLQLPVTGHRLAHIDQLLLVDPRRVPALNPVVPMMRIDNPQPWESPPRRDPHYAVRQWSGLTPPPNRHQVPNPTVAGGARREPLSRAELELLRPHLTVHVPAQARAGMVDIGTSLGTFDTSPTSNATDVTVLDAGTYPLDQWLAGERPLPNDPTLTNLGIVEATGNGNSTVRGVNYSTSAPRLAETGEGIAFLLPPTVNPNTAGDAVLATLVHPATAGATRVADLVPLSRADGTAMVDPVAVPPVSPNVRGPLHPAEHPQSAGVVTVESHGAGLDGAARRTAGEERRLVIQAVDQEGSTVRRWTTQADWWALAANRQVANLIAAPLSGRTSGSPRLVEAILDPTGPRGQFDQPGRLIAGPLPPFSQNAEWPATWRVDFGFDAAVAAAQADAPWGPADNRTDPSGAQVALLTDGARLTGAGVAGYLLAATAQTPMPLLPSALSVDATGLGPSWLSLHVRFDDPATPATLLASRAPVNGSATSTLGVEISGAAASNDSQHRWELLYDADESVLRLVVANGAIPASGTSGLLAGWDDPKTEILDERALGAGASDAGDLAQMDPIGTAGMPLAAPELRVRFTPVKDRWYHLLIVQVHDQPGGTAILIDGLLGQDWANTGGASLAAQGDYVALPSLRLGNALPAVDASVVGGAGLWVERITLEPPPGFAAVDLLPARGLVRIHDEYIAYGSLDGNDLVGCIRARRVNTNTVAAGEQWPQTQNHAAGSRVLPGWYRYDVRGGSLYPGSTRLAQELGTGHDEPSPTFPKAQVAGWTGPGPTLIGSYHALDDLRASATPANLRFRTWGWIEAPTVQPPNATYPTGYRRLDLSTTAVLDEQLGDWPSTGQVRFFRMSDNGEAFATRWFTRTGNTLTLAPANTQVVDLGLSDAVYALVTSVRIADYPSGFNLSQSQSQAKAVQATAPDGRVEWLRYTSATTPGVIDGHYLIDGTTQVNGPPIFQGGFPYLRNALASFRGSMRTAFLDEATLRPFGSIPIDSEILPVQDEGAGHNIYGLESGDVVTLVPAGTWRPDLRPVQMHVRFAASDGFAWNPPAQGRFDTKNQWFTFTQPLSASAPSPSQGLSVVVGRGWTGGQSMSTDSFIHPRTGLMPRIEAFGDGFAAMGDPQWGPRTALGPDRDRGSPWTEVAGFQLDAVGAGALTGVDGLQPGGFGISTLGGGLLDAIPASGGLPMSVTASRIANSNPLLYLPLFRKPMGLVLIDGEVFAYRRPDRQRLHEAILIARGLLGTRSVEHRLSKSSAYANKPADGILSAIELPIGPIGILGDHSGVTVYGEGQTDGHSSLPPDAAIGHSIRTGPNSADLFPGAYPNEYQAPAFVISLPDGSSIEALALLPDPVRSATYPNAPPPTNGQVPTRTLPGKALTAPWLRGMWGTGVRDWQGGQGDGLDPVIIPWWPRHASALPYTMPSEQRVLSGLLRSRRYQWAGPAIRLHGMRVDRGPVGHSFTTVPSTGGLSRPELRGFAPLVGATPAQLFDWSSAIPLSDSSGTWSGGPAAEVDGAEYRHHLVYLRADSGWSVIPDAAAERLEITTGEVRAAAPVRILASEAGR